MILGLRLKVKQSVGLKETFETSSNVCNSPEFLRHSASLIGLG